MTDNKTLKVYTPAEVAELLGFDRVTVYRFLKSGVLPGRRVGARRWYILEDDLRDYLRAQKEQTQRRR